MALNEVLKHIDDEIARLQQARDLLVGSAAHQPESAPRGRQRANPKEKSSEGTKPKRKLSPEGRKAIADAMKRRWAERRANVPA